MGCRVAIGKNPSLRSLGDGGDENLLCKDFEERLVPGTINVKDRGQRAM